MTIKDTRFISFTGSRDVGLRINERASKLNEGQIWIKRVIAEMGGKDTIVVDKEADLRISSSIYCEFCIRFLWTKMFSMFPCSYR